MAVITERQERWRDIRRAIRQRSLPEFAMALLGVRWCGNNCPPTGGNQSLWVHQKVDFDDVRVISFIDDGGWVGIGTPNDWHTTSIRPATMRRMAAWILWQWARDWFGLRSDIYYRALHRKVSGNWRNLGTPDRKHARICREGDRDRILREAAEERQRIEAMKRAQAAR
jgi:hypothetical protein